MKVIENHDYSRLIAAATQRIPCDLSIKSINLVNVLTGEIYPASVDILDGVIVHVQVGGDYHSIAKQVYDGKGRYLMPGFIDIHMHIESAMLTPENFGKQAILSGTTCVVVDPHEIANVCGMRGVAFMVENAKKSPVRQFNLAPSCIPSDSEFETAPYPVKGKEMGQMLDMEGVYGIAEVMDSHSVIHDKPFIKAILDEGRKRGVVMQGHACNVTGREMSAYRLSGIINTHTVMSGEDVRECMRMGIHANMQSSSLATMFALGDLLRGTEGMRYWDELSVCTDDVHAKDMKQRGHINAIFEQLLALKVNELDAIRLCTFNPAREMDFEDLGAIAPGFVADFQLVEALDGRNPFAVFVGGQQKVEAGCLLNDDATKSVVAFDDTVQLQPVKADDFLLKVDAPRAQIAVVDCSSNNRFTYEQNWEELPIKNGHVNLTGMPSYCHVAVLNRFGRETKCIAIYRDFGLKTGAMATTISHDCHNIVVAYQNPEDAALAVNRLREIGGGILAVNNGCVLKEVPLPIAGLMSPLPCDELVCQLDEMGEMLKVLWAEEQPSILKLSLLALTVLPGISMTDTSLVNGTTREKISAYRRIDE